VIRVNPQLAAKDVVKEMGRIWQAMSEAQKLPYQQMFKQEQERF